MTERFSRVPPQAMGDKRLKLTELRVLIAICYSADENGHARPGMRLLAERTGIARQNVWAAIKKLADLDYIRVEIVPKPRGGTRSEYTVAYREPVVTQDRPARTTRQPAGGGISGHAVSGDAVALPEHCSGNAMQHGMPGDDGTACRERRHGMPGDDATACPGMPEQPIEQLIEQPPEQPRAPWSLKATPAEAPEGKRGVPVARSYRTADAPTPDAEIIEAMVDQHGIEREKAALAVRLAFSPEEPNHADAWTFCAEVARRAGIAWPAVAGVA